MTGTPPVLPYRIVQLYNKFAQLGGANGMTRAQLQELAEVRHNPLRDRIAACFACDAAGVVSYRAFLETITAFLPDADRDRKIQMAFKLYDVDGDGKVGKADLRHILSATCTFAFPEVEPAVAKGDTGKTTTAGDDKAGAEPAAGAAAPEGKQPQPPQQVEGGAAAGAAGDTAAQAPTAPSQVVVVPADGAAPASPQQDKRGLEVIDKVIGIVMSESSSDGDREYLSLEDFKKVLEHTDFMTLLVIDF